MRFLARREHSRAELRRKLLRDDVEAALLEILLDDLEAKGLLSDRRYAQMVAQSKGYRYGVASLERTLARQGVAPELAAEALIPLRDSERERALEICRRRSGEVCLDLKERLKLHRFLLGRGFHPATISWVLKQCQSAPGGEDS